MFNKLKKYLRTLPIIGRVCSRTHRTAGLFSHDYDVMCVVVNYSGIAQTFAFNKSEFVEAKNRADKYFDGKHKKLDIGYVISDKYVQSKLKHDVVITKTAYVVKVVDQDDTVHILAFTEAAVKDAVAYGLKVTSETPMTVSRGAKILHAICKFVHLV